jgi:hypothetical protein
MIHDLNEKNQQLNEKNDELIDKNQVLEDINVLQFEAYENFKDECRMDPDFAKIKFDTEKRHLNNIISSQAHKISELQKVSMFGWWIKEIEQLETALMFTGSFRFFLI